MIHYGFYVLVALMAGTGLATAILAGLNRIVFQNSGRTAAIEFRGFPYLRGALLGRDGVDRLSRVAHTGRALPSIHQKRWAISANVLRRA
jgi:hypothetical protein